MPIIVRNSDLNEEAVSALNQLLEMDINATSAFRLSRIIKEISSIVEDKIKMERKILDKWTMRDEQGNPVPAKNDQGEVIPGAVNISDADSFTREMSELMALENEIPFDRISFESLALKTAKIKDLMKLEFLFD